MKLTDLNPRPFVVVFLLATSWLIAICAIRGGMVFYSGLFGETLSSAVDDLGIAQAELVSSQNLEQLFSKATGRIYSPTDNPTVQMGRRSELKEDCFFNLNQFGWDVAVFTPRGDTFKRGDRGQEIGMTKHERQTLSRPENRCLQDRALSLDVVPRKKSTLVKDVRPAENISIVELPFLM